MQLCKILGPGGFLHLSTSWFNSVANLPTVHNPQFKIYLQMSVFFCALILQWSLFWGGWLIAFVCKPIQICCNVSIVHRLCSDCAQIVHRLCALLGLKSPFSRPCATQHKVTLWAILHWALIMGRWLVARQFKSVALWTFCNCDSYLLADCIWKATVAQKIRGTLDGLTCFKTITLCLHLIEVMTDENENSRIVLWQTIIRFAGAMTSPDGGF